MPKNVVPYVAPYKYSEAPALWVPKMSALMYQKAHSKHCISQNFGDTTCIFVKGTSTTVSTNAGASEARSLVRHQLQLMHQTQDRVTLRPDQDNYK